MAAAGAYIVLAIALLMHASALPRGDPTSHMICKSVGDVFVASSPEVTSSSQPLQGRDGKRGPAGPPGARGISGLRGMRGEKGEMDASVVESLERRWRSFADEILSQRLPSTCLTSTMNGRQTLLGGQEAYCDGGWTVFQKRYDGSVNFQRPWADYKRGFGNLSGEFWLGLDKIHNLTKDRGCRLRIDLWDFDNDHRHALYSDFSVEDESDLYRLHIGGYSGTAGDSLSTNDGSSRYLNGKPFTTMDRDNDLHADNCAVLYGHPRGGFWYHACTMAYLNGDWGNPNLHWWLTWKGEENLMKTVMKLRCD